MTTGYRYIDPDYTYTDPQSGVMRNKAGIDDDREGNGRTQREFLRLLALEKELDLNLNPPDNADIYERYRSGTINSDVKMLSELILDIIIPS